MAAAADRPRLLSLIALFLITARETLQRPEQLHSAASSLHTLLPQELSWKGLLDLCHCAKGTSVSTQPFLSVLPSGRAPGIALVLLLALMLVRLHTQNCSGPCCCAASSSSAKA